ncbi:hypothetical protein PYW08_009851 [Mythimna loreyi]|uniref:Uncharacterized protein n=1 Tax=Mythimna loreyi TaxID=667449 RepID=A0ACC2Q7L4_9NEOP|nr:hypothetical protein PYW08_009851 [Mythimna loreyi]
MTASCEICNFTLYRMSSILSKNVILYGQLDYYCLVCDGNFTTEDAALSHILDVLHKEALKKCGYLEKLKNHLIRKCKGIYFCEPCSLTFPTLTKVELHIDEETHISARNKINPFIREKNQIIAFNRFIISVDAWNGCIEDTCVLCNTEFDDAAEHMAIRDHVLKLIRSEVIVDEDNSTVYRTIDDRSKQCLTCNAIIASDIESHFATAAHKEAYKLYDETNGAAQTATVTQNGHVQVPQTATSTQNGHVQVNGEKKEDKNAIKDVKESTDEKVKVEKKEDKNANKVGKKSSTAKEVNGEKKEEKNANKDVKESTGKEVEKDSKKEEVKKEDTKPPGEKKVKRKFKRSANKENAKELDKLYCKNLGAENYITGEYGSRWCILCEWLLDEPSEVHIRRKHHQNLLKIHNERLEEIDNNSSKDEESIPHDAVEKFQKNNVNIDLINETAFCKKCSKNIDFNTEAIEAHIEEHKKTPIKKSPETLSSGIKSDGTNKTTLYTKPVLLEKQKRSPKAVSVGEYAKQHGFTHNVADCSYYCRPCSRRLNTTLDDLQKHVASKIHMENTKQSSKTRSDIAPVKEPLFSFIKTFELVDTLNDGNIIIINDKFWLNSFGFFLIARKNERIFCHGCHIDLNEDNVVQHIIVTDYHRQIVEKCLLITSLENEFIREIKLDVYHCGYCNKTENDWDDIVDHIAMAEHKKEKAKAEASLSRHRPNLYHRRSLKEIDDMIQQFVLRNP